MNRVFTLSVSAKMQLSSNVIASQRYGHTDREVLGAEAEQCACEWATQTSWDDLLNHPVAVDFRALASSASCLSGDNIVLYRGQVIGETEPIPPSIERLGPLPLHFPPPREGRYHREGQRVLYLADSEDGVRRELDASNGQGDRYVIRVELPLTTLRIADFSDWPIDHLVTAVISKAEMCNLLNRGSDNYRFSQVVGNLVGQYFDGMRIPGVRGAPGAHYKNIVLFRGLEDWPSWTSSANPPVRMRPP